MTPRRHSRVLPLEIAALLAAAAPPLMGAECPDGGARREWHFDVSLDGQPIGHHDFTVSGTDDTTEVETRAYFVVTMLHIPVYRYAHEDHERWRSGCLAGIDAETNDNGDRTQVHGGLGAAGFDVSGPHGASTWSECVRTFAYWDRRILTAQRLLNAETGEYEPVKITREADAGASADASDHYQIDGRHLHIKLWYSTGGEWRGLESRLEHGKTLRYDLRC